MMLGSVNAALFKSLTKTIDLKAVPDLSLEYYLKDNVNSSGKSGVYKNTKNISQSITTSATPGNTIYRIAIPIDDTGFYTLSFNVDFWKGTSATADIFVRTLDTPVGCQVVHSKQIPIKSGTVYSMAPDNTTNNGYVYGGKLQYDDLEDPNLSVPLLNAKDHYQWKTLAPSRKEKVDLTYSVNDDDITNGYVTWVWDFKGLVGSTNYTLNLTDISITKLEPNDETKPYFEFMNTQYVNNAIAPTQKDVLSNSKWYGANTSGYTRHNAARGTYVTNGTYNSITMQASPLFKCWSEYGSHRFLTGADSSDKAHSNVLVFNVPIINVKKGTSYRVSFDFSVARQGHNNNLELDDYEYQYKDPPSYSHGSVLEKDVNYASTYNQFFNDTDPNGTLQFQSFLHSGAEDAYNLKGLTDSTGRQQVNMLNKRFSTHWLTRYDEIMSVPDTSNETTCKYTSNIANSNTSHAEALNSGLTSDFRDESFSCTFTNEDGEKETVTVKGGGGINWLNAIRHSEINGDNKINWLTFYNTSFTFNIDPNDIDVTVGSDGYCNDLYWTWTIDALEQTAWYRIKIENVRIEEVVQYGSYFDANGMKLAGSDEGLVDFFPNGNATKVSTAVVDNTFRSANGTGQNFGARGYVEQMLSATNIFGAIYDAGDESINGNYQITLSGYCAAKGGVEKYVWSADGGKTWNDMLGGTVSSFDGDADDNYVSKYCEKFVDQAFVGRTDKTSTYVKDTYDSITGYSVDNLYKHSDGYYYDHVDFQEEDGINFRFENIIADLSEYKYQHNLDIIFAAVPRSNPLLRCEILRIINYNSTKNYRTYTNDFISDIEVMTSGNKLNATYNATAESTVQFTNMYGIKCDTGTPSSAGGYAFRTATSHDYSEVRTLFSDFPIKTSLQLKGWAIVQGGVEKYMWSADYGKSWSSEWANSTLTSSAISTSQRENWYDGKATADATLSTNSSFDLTVDLSEYIGQVVDIIVAAKPQGSDALCPVSRIDNVAVYGDSGTFYTKILGVTAGSTALTPTYFHIDKTVLNGVTKNVTTDALAQWNLNYGANNAEEFAYTIFEPYNVDVTSTRFYNNSVNNIAAGENLTINGYMACKGGITEFRYSFDEGETYKTVTRDNTYVLHSGGINNALKSDSSFVADDYANGNFSTENGGSDLVIEIPAELKGSERNLLVYAVNGTGEQFPILHLKLNIT